MTTEPNTGGMGFGVGRTIVVLLLLVGVLLAAAVFSLLVGPSPVDLGRAFSGDDSNNDVYKLTTIRLPRATAAIIVGACLSLAGVIFQALIRNPLASPYILGVSAGGSLGAVSALALGFAVVVPFAFIGSLLAIVLVYLTARTRGRVPADTLLLAGVIVNSFFAACIMFVTYTTGSDRTLRIMRWLMGGLSDFYRWETLLASGVVLLLATVVVASRGRAMNLVSIGDDTAERLGVDVPLERNRLFLVASLVTAIAVSISGPIGFVGLVIPHILRLIIGPEHRLLVPASVLAGGAFLTVADTTAQVLWDAPLPVGLVTAFIGGPFFIWLMKSRDVRRSGHGF